MKWWSLSWLVLCAGCASERVVVRSGPPVSSVQRIVVTETPKVFVYAAASPSGGVVMRAVKAKECALLAQEEVPYVLTEKGDGAAPEPLAPGATRREVSREPCEAVAYEGAAITALGPLGLATGVTGAAGVWFLSQPPDGRWSVLVDGVPAPLVWSSPVAH